MFCDERKVNKRVMTKRRSIFYSTVKEEVDFCSNNRTCESSRHALVSLLSKAASSFKPSNSSSKASSNVT